ncbi:hypothetical protein DENSPDRAFT_796610 [Dentipellis sp. KUC8613]|nr:hypothetical protein DENSPDRAFT_796610 [Dentipellis sp. KUC8613]
MNLRDSLLAALASLPGTREIHIHVLVTAPRKYSALYPYAIPRPRLYAQDILVLLSEQPDPDAPRVLVSAIEGCLYHSPTTSTAILYVGKVDSTGQGMAPPPTATLVKAFVRWYADPATRPVPAEHLWVHLFARAQGQYLFPNSVEYEGKKPLSDRKLCAWWRRVLGEVAGQVLGSDSMRDGGRVKLYYILPGCNELEASQILGSAISASSSSLSLASPQPAWTYGHPYSQTEFPLPCPPPTADTPNLGHFIPSFEDDPKNRFMDEIALLTEAEGTKSPVRKRPRLASRGGKTEKDADHEKEKEKEHARDEKPKGELGSVKPDEFWDRMSFRQECVAGAITGFFVAIFSSPPYKGKPVSRPSPLAPQPGQVPTAMNKRILTSLMQGNEFSTLERGQKATEILEGAIRGLCEGLTSTTAPTSRSHVPEGQSAQTDGDGLLVVPRTPPRKNTHLPSLEDISPNPFDEPEATLETYRAHIYGSVYVSNPPLPPKAAVRSAETDGAGDGAPQAPKVNVLTVRKKKKKTDA